jgi:hypothetical protein
MHFSSSYFENTVVTFQTDKWHLLLISTIHNMPVLVSTSPTSYCKMGSTEKIGSATLLSIKLVDGRPKAAVIERFSLEF